MAMISEFGPKQIAPLQFHPEVLFGGLNNESFRDKVTAIFEE